MGEPSHVLPWASEGGPKIIRIYDCLNGISCAFRVPLAGGGAYCGGPTAAAQIVLSRSVRDCYTSSVCPSVRPSVRSILVLRRNGCRHRQTFHQLVSYGQSRPLHSTQSNGLDWPSPTIFPHYVPCVQKKRAN